MSFDSNGDSIIDTVMLKKEDPRSIKERKNPFSRLRQTQMVQELAKIIKIAMEKTEKVILYSKNVLKFQIKI
jgi:hypothetical protein